VGVEPRGEPLLAVRDLVVRYEGREALRGVGLDVRERELVCVLGPSGSGKSTLLRAIAGLEPPTTGRIAWQGRDVGRLPAHARGFGLMFQDYALFPHHDVAGNVGFGLRMAGWDASRARARVAELLDLVGLAGMGSRRVSELSGGEQQRVALARALAPSPRLLMLDEPMGSLDRALRERLPLELRDMLAALGVAVIYVTHDQEEALMVADRVVILRDGRVAADDAPERLWSRPPSGWTARFLGFRNVAAARLVPGGLATPWGRLPHPDGGADERTAPAPGPGRAVTVVLRPDGLLPRPDGRLRGTVVARRFRGDHALLVLAVPADAGGEPAILEVEARWDPLPAVGDALSLAVEPRAVVVIDDDPTERATLSEP
jgi:thiamine transport system ATP-binding protein